MLTTVMRVKHLVALCVCMSACMIKPKWIKLQLIPILNIYFAIDDGVFAMDDHFPRCTNNYFLHNLNV